MAVLSFMVNRHHKHNPHEQEPTREDESIRTVRDHYIAVHSFLSDFHKAQCYLSIALQIAGLIILFKDPSATSYSDMHFLYFVAVDGLFPIIITLYTLMTFGKKSWYMISLSGISIILSSIMGGHLSFSIRDMTRNGSTGGGSWPDICGGVGPTTLCNGVGSNAVTYGSVVSAFLYAMVAIDVLFFLFIVWKLFTETTNLWESGTRGISRVFKANPRWLRRCITYFLHVLAIALIIFFLALDMHYFHLTFQGPFVDFTGWSFGQIVGITTWAGAFVDFIYLEYSKLYNLMLNDAFLLHMLTLCSGCFQGIRMEAAVFRASEGNYQDPDATDERGRNCRGGDQRKGSSTSISATISAAIPAIA